MMNKQEFLKLFNIEEIYSKHKNKIPFCLGLHDRLIGSKNAVYYIFRNNNKFKLSIECSEFSEEVQELEVNLILDENNIKLYPDEPFNNDLFNFLSFDTDLDVDLRFVADFSNKILIPKYKLMGGITTY